MVKDYKYLAIHIDNRLNWKTVTTAVYKRGISRRSFLRKLRSIVENVKCQAHLVCSKVLEIYQSVVTP